MKLNLKSLKDKLESYFKSKGFTAAKAEEIGKDCISRLSALASGGHDPDDASLRSVINDVLEKAGAPSSGSPAPAGSTPLPSLADDVVTIVKDIAKRP